MQLAQTAQEALLQGSTAGYGAFAPMNGASGEEDAVIDKRKKRAYKKRDPNAPKRPQTAYFRYLNENRPHFAAELAQSTPAGTQRPGDITKLATEKWHQLTHDQQQPYREAYQKELKTYEAAVNKYKAEGGDPDAFGELHETLLNAAQTPAPTAPPIAAVANDDSSSEDESSDSSESEDEPPPPPKTPSSKPKGSAKKAAKEKEIAEPIPFPSQPEAAQEALPAKPPPPQRKRKSAATANAESSEPKRSRTTPKTEVATPAPKEKEKEKKKRKSKSVKQEA